MDDGTNNSNNSNDINIIELISYFWKKKLTIISITGIAAIISVIYSLSLPNIYTSSTLVAVANEKSSLSSKLGGYSSIAGLAGISIPRESNNSLEAIERIKSFDFFSEHFLPYIKLENLLAIKEWNPENNTILYDEKIFNNNSKKWIREKLPTIPSNQEAYREYKDILTIYEDNKTLFVTISIDHQSPHIAKKWVEIIVKNINESMRNIDKKNALDSINFLNKEVENTNLKETKEAISKLVESQLQNLMLTSASESYVYKTLNAPIAPEKKTSPSRAIICILITFLGGVLGIFVAFIQFYRNEIDAK